MHMHSRVVVGGVDGVGGGVYVYETPLTLMLISNLLPKSRFYGSIIKSFIKLYIKLVLCAWFQNDLKNYIDVRDERVSGSPFINMD